MKISHSLFVVFIITALAACAAHHSDPAAASSAKVLLPKDATYWTQRIRSVLPPGWTVTTDGDSILVARDQPVQWSPAGPNGPAFANPADAAAYAQAHASSGPYVIKFTFEPFMPLDEHARLRAANASAQARKEALQSSIRDLPHMGDSYSADNSEQAARLAAYKQAVAQLTFTPLPNFNTTNYSVTLWVPDSYTQVLPPAADECNLVKSVLINLFTPYP